MIIIILLAHFGPSIYWGATGTTFVAPLLWSLVGAVYSVAANSRVPKDLMSMGTYFTEKRSTRLLRAALMGLLLSALLNVIGYLMGLVISHASGVTKTIVAFVFGYLIAGLYYVLHNLRLPTIKQPAFVRPGSRSVSSLIIGPLFWPAESLFILYWGWKDRAPRALGVFAGDSQRLLTWAIFLVATFVLGSI